MAVQLHGLAHSIQTAPLGRDYICGDCGHLCAALQGCSDERHSARIADKIVPIAFMTGGAQPALGVSKCESHPARMAIRVGLAGNCSDPQPPLQMRGSVPSRSLPLVVFISVDAPDYCRGASQGPSQPWES
jgi:hypothetical protein